MPCSPGPFDEPGRLGSVTAEGVPLEEFTDGGRRVRADRQSGGLDVRAAATVTGSAVRVAGAVRVTSARRRAG